MHKQLLIKNFIKDKYVGAIFPTSKAVINEIIKKINFATANVIVEYGAGTGVITKELLLKMNTNARLFVIETNPEFIEILNQIKDNRLYVVNGNAVDVNELLADYNLPLIDYVISGIPFSFFIPIKRMSIVRNTCKIIKDGGKFIVYQYSSLMEKYLYYCFNKVNKQFALANIPPVVLFEAIK